jgi:diaminopimelate epimerase
MKKLKFCKYHGLGNDFLIIDLIGKNTGGIDYNKLAAAICDRHFGVGADGILVLTGSRKADCTMDLFNSDGSWAEKSGNGLRCVAAYLRENIKHSKTILIENTEGISKAIIIRHARGKSEIRVNIGKPCFDTAKIPMKSKFKYHINQPIKVLGQFIPVTALAVGNPHCVIFVDDFEFNWMTLGEHVENHPDFPNRTNVEFVKVLDTGKAIVNDWERGAGATGSSGTGAAAAAVAGVLSGILKRKVEIIFPSGSLFIHWNESDDHIYLTGPAQYVFEGVYHFDGK